MPRFYVQSKVRKTLEISGWIKVPAIKFKLSSSITLSDETGVGLCLLARRAMTCWIDSSRVVGSILSVSIWDAIVVVGKDDGRIQYGAPLCESCSGGRIRLFLKREISILGAEVMGKGYDENQERLAVLQGFGKDLALRAKSTCELSGAKGIALKLYEVRPAPKDPDFERCLLLSQETIAALEKPALFVAHDWRHLGELIWSQFPLQQVMAYRILTYLAPKYDWCAEILEEAYLEDEVVAEGQSAPLI